MHFTPPECHMQGLPSMDTFSAQHYSSASTVPDQKISASCFQMMTTPSREAAYAPTPHPSPQVATDALTTPFTSTAHMPLFSSICEGDNLQAHLSAPLTPVSDLLYSVTSLTPNQMPMKTDSPQVSNISFHSVKLSKYNYYSAINHIFNGF